MFLIFFCAKVAVATTSKMAKIENIFILKITKGSTLFSIECEINNEHKTLDKKRRTNDDEDK
jgi:hypothetical protein